MADLPDPWNELLRVGEMHKGLINLSLYVLRECGGLICSLLYGWLLYWTWDALNLLGKTLFILAGCFLTLLTILHPYAWRLRYKRIEKDYKKVEESADFLCDAIFHKSVMGYGEYQEPVQKLKNSLIRLRGKYFS